MVSMGLPMMGMPRESGRTMLIPRPHQLAARDAILAARRECRPGFLLGDLTGLGKTLSVWAALAAMPEDEILIVCPKGGCRSGAERWP
jgi:superfamily II DNA or RNA helicase